MQEILLKTRYFERGLSKTLKKLTIFSRFVVFLGLTHHYFFVVSSCF